MFRRLFRQDKAWVFADQAVVSGCAALTQVILAAQLGMKSYGYFSLVVLAQLFLLSLQQAGITGIYQVHAPTLTGEQRSIYHRGICCVQCGFTAFLLLLGALFCLAPDLVFTGWDKAAIVLNVVLFLLQDFWRKILITGGRTKQTLVIDVLNNGLQIAGLLAMMLLGGTSLSAALWVCALSFVPAILLGQLWAGTRGFPLANALGVFKVHKAQGSWMLLAALLQWAAGNFYLLAAGWWLGPAVLGALRLGQYLFGLLNVLLQAIENYALPKAAAAVSDPGQVIGYLKVMLRKMMVIMLPLLLLMLIGGKPLLWLLCRRDIQSGFTILSGLTITYVFVVIACPLHMALRIFGLNRAYFGGYALAAVFSMSTAYLFIHFWSLAGVMAGVALAQLILILYWLTILQKQRLVSWKSFTSS